MKGTYLGTVLQVLDDGLREANGAVAVGGFVRFLLEPGCHECTYAEKTCVPSVVGVELPAPILTVVMRCRFETGYRMRYRRVTNDWR
jgi:hypothetical protein